VRALALLRRKRARESESLKLEFEREKSEQATRCRSLSFPLFFSQGESIDAFEQLEVARSFLCHLYSHDLLLPRKQLVTKRA
jgi:hypothetical protein